MSTNTATRPRAIAQPTILRWEAPPPSRRRRKHERPSPSAERWQPVVDDLRANRGEWGVIYDGPFHGGPSALARNIRTGALTAFAPTGDFEATYRRYGDRLVVHACYLGDDGE